MISVLVPFAGDCPHRKAAWDFLRPRWERFGEVIEGTCDGPWVKAVAVHDALIRSTGDTLIIADADVWVDPTGALEHLETWAVPHKYVHRLSESSTGKVLAGADWQRLPLDRSNLRDMRRYTGQAAGGVVVMRREVYEDVPLPRYEGWGHEDRSWDMALTTLVGQMWRGTEPLVHFWHPPQPRVDRRVGSTESVRELGRFQLAQNNPQMMRELVEEKRVA